MSDTKTVRAIRFHGQGDVRVEQVAAPDPVLGRSDVLLAPLFCGICGTDLHEFVAGPIVTPKEPNALTGATLPQILGHEFSARVLAVGEGVSSVAPGDRVSIQPLMGPDDDYYVRRGLVHLSETLGVVGLSWQWGGMGQRAVVQEKNVIKVPDALDDRQAALIEPAAVAVYALDRSRIKVGDTVLVSGLGPIGALTMLAAKAAGASRIFVSETNPTRLALARDLLPEAITIDPRSEDLAAIVRAHTESGVGVDAALECVGNEASFNGCIAAVRRQGVVVQVGLHTKRASVDPMVWALKDLSIEAVWCYPVQIWPRIATMIASGAFPVEKIVTSVIAMDDVVEKGFKELLDPAGRQLKVLVRIEESQA